MPFPLIKLAYMAMRQLSKPLANRLKATAKKSDFFRDKVCKPPAQLYHWYDTRVKMYALGLTKPEHVSPLTDAQAVELGAEMVGEFVIFSVGALVLYLEYKRSYWKEEQKETLQNERLLRLEYQIDNLQRAVENQSEIIEKLSTSQVAEITRKILNKLTLRSQPNAEGEETNPSRMTNNDNDEVDNRDILSQAITHVLEKSL